MVQHKYSNEEICFLKDRWNSPIASIDITEEFNKTFGTEIIEYTLASRCRTLFGNRPAEAVKEIKRNAALKMCERRGEDFNEKQRVRAKYREDWLGGKHHNGNESITPEKWKEYSKRSQVPEVRSRIVKSRNKTIEKERKLIAWGLPQKTKLKLGSALSKEQRNCRNQMIYEHFYFSERNDKTLYYDEQTKRSEHYEERARRAGLEVVSAI